uniref:ARID domain-containing protein n=1 Tax=Callorhinchus milii TaxID=7868 RepID=A0A4W3GVW5_CALMI
MKCDGMEPCSEPVKLCGAGAGEDSVQASGLEQQHFITNLYRFMKESNRPIERIPHLGFKQVNLWTMYRAVEKLGGYEAVTTNRLWKNIYDELGGNPGSTSAATCTRRHYERLVLPYERHMKGEEDKPLPPLQPRKQYKVLKNREGRTASTEQDKPGKRKASRDTPSTETPTVSSSTFLSGPAERGVSAHSHPGPHPRPGPGPHPRPQSTRDLIMSPLAKKKFLAKVSDRTAATCPPPPSPLGRDWSLGDRSMDPSDTHRPSVIQHIPNPRPGQENTSTTTTTTSTTNCIYIAPFTSGLKDTAIDTCLRRGLLYPSATLRDSHPGCRAGGDRNTQGRSPAPRGFGNPASYRPGICRPISRYPNRALVPRGCGNHKRLSPGVGVLRPPTTADSLREPGEKLRASEEPTDLSLPRAGPSPLTQTAPPSWASDTKRGVLARRAPPSTPPKA